MIPSPTQRSTFRERRIQAMLHEATPLSAQLPDPDSQTQEPKAPRWRLSRRLLVCASIATALLCAAAMFFLLFRHDASNLVQNVPVQPVQPALVSGPATPLTTPAAASAQPATPVERIPFKLRHANRLQNFGLVNLRLITTDPRRGTCSLLVAVADHRATQRRLQVNHPVQIAATSTSQSTVTVSGINKDSVTGFVTNQ